MDNRGLLDLIICRLPDLVIRDKIYLSETFESEGDLIKSSKGDIEIILKHNLKEFWNIDEIRSIAEHDAKTAHVRGITWVSWRQAAYPPLLREIYDPPVILFYRGALPNPEKPLVAIVGTRRPSPQAASAAFDIGRDLGRQGLSVVSGLALGIDAMAHRGNLDGGAPTFAIMGSGADDIYPRANRVLAQRILENGGGLISEYPPGTKPFKWHFPARNRIISGISRGALIVEAPESSGALITAAFAAEHSRDIWVSSVGADLAGIAENPPSRGSRYDRRGTAKLAENGSKIISGALDILAEWNIEVRNNYNENNSQDRSGGKALALKLARSFDIDL